MKKQQDGYAVLLFLYYSSEEASAGAASAGSSTGSVYGSMVATQRLMFFPSS